MCLGGLFLGYGIANMQLYRFAAVELAPGHYRAQAISYVTAGGVLAGIVGPALARFTPDLWLPLFQASFVRRHRHPHPSSSSCWASSSSRR